MNKCYKKVSALISVLIMTGMTFANYSIDNNIAFKSASENPVSNEYLEDMLNNNVSRDECSDSFVVYGSDDLDGDGTNDPCYSDGSGYYSFVWTGGCTALSLEYSGGELDISSYGFTEGFWFYGFDPGTTETFVMTFDSGSVGAGEATNDCATCEELGQVTCWDGSCADSFDECPEEGTCPDGQVLDCDGSNECHPESWIGDGYPDCNDQQYGADLTCYDCDGGDCPETDPGCSGSCEDQGLVTCWDGSCANSYDDCPEEPELSDPTDVCIVGSNFDPYNDGNTLPAVTLTWFDPNAFCGDGTCNGDEDYDTCPEDCNAPGECDEGFVPDCADDDCCPESWIGDGFEDCEDQQYGCDLTCYDNDGGDCGGRECEGMKDYSDYNIYNARQINSNNDTRAIVASLYFEVLEGYNAGFTNTWTTTGQEFTVYGFDASDYVCVTVSYCDDSNGACSDGVGPVCAQAGDESSQECADGGGGPDVVLGDVNFDSEINVLDIVIIVNHILGTELLSGDAAVAADYNEDGEVNVLDIVQMVNVILGGGRADSDSANDVELVLNSGHLNINQSGVAGLQLEVTGNYSDLSSKSYDLYYNNGTILVISLDGQDITGKVFDFTGSMTINDMIVSSWSGEEVAATIVTEPGAFTLHPAYPNPFNPVTNISYDVASNSLVNISVYDVLGRNMETLVNEVKVSGTYSINWNDSTYSSGVYYVKMVSGNASQMQKVVLMK